MNYIVHLVAVLNQFNYKIYYLKLFILQNFVFAPNLPPHPPSKKIACNDFVRLKTMSTCHFRNEISKLNDEIKSMRSENDCVRVTIKNLRNEIKKISSENRELQAREDEMRKMVNAMQRLLSKKVGSRERSEITDENGSADDED